jgi:hypothetical protein
MVVVVVVASELAVPECRLQRAKGILLTLSCVMELPPGVEQDAVLLYHRRSRPTSEQLPPTPSSTSGSSAAPWGPDSDSAPSPAPAVQFPLPPCPISPFQAHAGSAQTYQPAAAPDYTPPAAALGPTALLPAGTAAVVRQARAEARDLGDVRVCLWWSPSVVLQAHAPREVSSLVARPGEGKAMPATVHCDSGTLYEEPCLVYIKVGGGGAGGSRGEVGGGWGCLYVWAGCVCVWGGGGAVGGLEAGVWCCEAVVRLSCSLACMLQSLPAQGSG